MLQPTNRLTLLDAMRPPPGYGVEDAMAVTFTLDLRALLAAPAAFALSNARAVVADGGRHEPIELLHAVRSHADKLTIFNQVGEIALPPSRRVFAFLERAVIPVQAPLGGVVHPKVWVLRYSGSTEETRGDRRLRVLAASRNLSFDASWDTVIRFDESDNGRGADLTEVGALFEGLMGAARIGVAEAHRERVGSLAAALCDARFAFPVGVDGVRVHVIGLTSSPTPLPAVSDRSLVISPFVGDDFFTDAYAGSVDEMVSRPESLDRLGDDAFRRICAPYAFDDGSVVDLDPDHERLSPADPGRPLVGVHAKVFAFEIDNRAYVFLGSANATGAAFTRNVEILIELIGATGALGIDRLCDGTEDERGLKSLFLPYRRPERPDPETEDRLDSTRRAIARLGIHGAVEEQGDGWAVTYRSSDPLPAIEPGATVRCWPLSSPGNAVDVSSGEPLYARFHQALETISGFLAFELTDAEGRRTQFVVPVPLEGVPEQRDRLLFRSLVGNAERFLRYLVALLEDDPTPREPLDPRDGAGGNNRDEAGGPAGLPVLERLLRTMRRDPLKLVGLHPLVSDLGADHALPPGFDELWDDIYSVALDGAQE